MSGPFGGCEPVKAWYDEDGCLVLGIPVCNTDETSFKIPKPAEDTFTTGTLDTDAGTLTLDNLAGVDTPVVICLEVIQDAVYVDAEGKETPIQKEGKVLKIPAPISICWGFDDDGCVSIDAIKHCGTGEPLKINAVLEVTGNVVDNADPKRPVINAVATVNSVAPDAAGNVDLPSSSTVPAPAGFHTITTDDGVATAVCLDPVKSVNGALPDAAGNVDSGQSTTVPSPDGFHTITTDDGVATAVCLTPLKSINGVTGDINGNVNVADLFSTTVDNGDGTYTTTNADGTPVTWSGDTFASQMDNGDGTVTFTMADGSTVTLCLNPVKSVVQNADGFGATVTYADGTIAALAYPVSTAVTVGGQTTTTHPDGTTHTSCDSPVKSVNGLAPDAAGDVSVGQSTTVPAPAGFHTITTDDGVATAVCLDPVKSVNGALPDADGNVVQPSSSTTPSADGSIHTITTDDNVATDVCVNPLKGVREVAAGVWEIIAQDGSVAGTITDTTIPADGSFAVQSVAADGTVTDSNGDTVPAVDSITGDTLPAGSTVALGILADGTITSITLLEVDTTVMVEDAAGNLLPINPATNNQVLPEPSPQVTNVDQGDGTTLISDPANQSCAVPTSIPVKCDDSVYQKGETFKALTQEQGHAPSILTTATGLAGVDLSCAPDLPACPIDGALTLDDKGITWQIVGGVYVPVAFTPACKMDRNTAAQLTVNDAQMDANSGVVEILGSVCVEIVNDDCVPMEVSGRLRGFMLTQLSPGVRVVVSYVLDGANSSEIEFTDGTPTYTVDTRREGAGIQNDSEGTQIVGFESSDLLMPGETATACFNITLRVQNYVPTASNLLTLQTTIATIKGSRCVRL